MESREILEQSFNLVARDFGTGELPEKQLSREFVKSWLTEKIQDLIDHQIERLWNILYRIDVNENRAREAISQCEPGELAAALAEMVLERQIEKIKTRIQYSEKKPE